MKVWLRTFGCRANHYDTEAVRTMIERGGHTIVSDVSHADVALFNSCAVTSDAVADLRQGIRRAARENPAIESVVMGCASALPDAGALKRLPTVATLVEGADLAAVATALGIDPPKDGPRTSEQTGTRGLLRIQDGCDAHCTFCATTIARGANRSRPVEELVEEALHLAERHAEIVITGIHIGTYGAEIGTTLGGLMTRLVASIPDVRFRLTSIEATEVDGDLLELMRSLPRRLAPNIHAPLQSGSNAVLRRMGRHWYTANTYRSAVERMASQLPAFGLGADLIAGFPGETDQDHGATVALVEALPFTYLHVFPYSPRPGTAAARLDGAIAPAVAHDRAHELRTIGRAKAHEYCASRVGRTADVIVIGGRVGRRGLTEDYLEISLADPSLARGERIDLTLESRDGRLVGVAADGYLSEHADGVYRDLRMPDERQRLGTHARVAGGTRISIG